MTTYQSSDDELITGEAVAIELPPATVGLRLGAGVVDVMVTYLLMIVVFLLLIWAAANASSRNLEAIGGLAVVTTSVVIYLAVPTAVGTLTRGKSLGKWIFGLRVVRDDGGTISFQHAFVRSLIAVVEIYAFFGGPAFVAMMLSRTGKRLGDQAAGTYVVRDRVRLGKQPRREMPPQLAGWAAHTDVAPFPTHLAVAVRQFLQRATTLDPATRARVAVDLANQVSPYVAPPPPPDTPAEAWLAAVMVIRRERDLERLSREAQLRQRLLS
jgi:uncharacterized RDD family membrane protein YckC